MASVSSRPRTIAAARIDLRRGVEQVVAERRVGGDGGQRTGGGQGRDGEDHAPVRTPGRSA